MKRKTIALTGAALLILLLCGGCGNHNVPGEGAGSETKVTDAGDAAVLPETEEDDGTKADAAEEAAGQETAARPEDGAEREQPFLVQITEDDPSIAYVLVRMPNPTGLLPLPTEGEYTRTIRRKMEDGTEAVNVLRLTPNGCRMEDANCEGHDCILEGEVTLENREERVLWNMIICLPHQLSLELITREEAEQLMR